VVYITAKKLVYMISVSFEKTLPGFDQHLPAKYSVFPLHFGSSLFALSEGGAFPY
jgi:hypothetical protein